MKKYKILLITAFDKPWNNGWYYRTGLEKNGHKVICVDPAQNRDEAVRTLDRAKEMRPDFILHTKNELPADVFEKCREFTRVIQWYPDPVVPAWLPDYVRASDIFLTMSEGLVEEFKKYNPSVFWLTQAFEPSFFDVKVVTEQDRRAFSTDVTFVGNLGSKEQYLSRRGSLEKILGAGLSLKWWGPRIPRKFSTIPLILSRLGRSYGGKFVWGQEYSKVAKLSKVFLAFDSRPDIRKSMSARMYTAVGCGAFYMCRHVDGIEEVLEPDKEIVTFRDDNEMLDKIRFFLKNGSLREDIAEAGRKRVMREHTYEVRMRELLGLLNHVL